jgi:hypothetical protein
MEPDGRCLLTPGGEKPFLVRFPVVTEMVDGLDGRNVAVHAEAPIGWAAGIEIAELSSLHAL